MVPKHQLLQPKVKVSLPEEILDLEMSRVVANQCQRHDQEVKTQPVVLDHEPQRLPSKRLNKEWVAFVATVMSDLFTPTDNLTHLS